MYTRTNNKNKRGGKLEMKFIRLLLVVMAAALITFGLSGMATAFHDGGVAHCDGCHSMHNSPDNPVETTDPTFSLLKGADESSTCLNCHAGGWDVDPGTGAVSRNYHVFSGDGSVLSPGGDFFWLTQDYDVIPWFGADPVPFEGQNTGHNVVASDYSLVADTNNAQAPGGTYLATDLTCASCHDPHGSGDTEGGGLPISGSGSYGGTPPAGTVFGSYRILTTDNGPAAPIAVADGSRGNQYTETDTSHVAYNSGMAAWCGGCHPQYLTGADKHDVDESLGSTRATNYRNYAATGDFDIANAPTSYLPLVAYEDASTDPTATTGAVAASLVTCISCHRSHASAFQNMGRWQFDAEYLADQIPDLSHVPAMSNVTNPYYGRDITTTFGQYQRSLCNKCHVND
jgi:hypothetical protein